MKMYRSVIYFILMLVVSNCDVTSSKETDPVYLKLGDTYVINIKYLSSVDEGDNYGYGYASYYEDGQVGLFESNKVNRLEITVKDDSLLIIKPILTGETILKMVQKFNRYTNYGYEKVTTITTYFIIRE